MGRKKPLIPHHLAHINVLKGDTVLIITGKDKGQEGKVERTFPRSSRVLVEGHNLAKRRMKPQQGTAQAGTIEKAMPLHISNVMVKCTECGEPTRVGHERVPQGHDQRVRVRRVCKKCGKPIQDQSRSIRS